jgi:hypothetical protein
VRQARHGRGAAGQHRLVQRHVQLHRAELPVARALHHAAPQRGARTGHEAADAVRQLGRRHEARREADAPELHRAVRQAKGHVALPEARVEGRQRAAGEQLAPLQLASVVDAEGDQLAVGQQRPGGEAVLVQLHVQRRAVAHRVERGLHRGRLGARAGEQRHDHRHEEHADRGDGHDGPEAPGRDEHAREGLGGAHGARRLAASRATGEGGGHARSLLRRRRRRRAADAGVVRQALGRGQELGAPGCSPTLPRACSATPWVTGR